MIELSQAPETPTERIALARYLAGVRGLSMSAVFRKAEISHQWGYSIIRGDRRSPDVERRIVEVLGEDAAVLFPPIEDEDAA